ncbi:MAG: GNAT family protein [bacterium]|nr:GNAT family protein [bacterium]
MDKQSIKVNDDIELRCWKPKWAKELFALTDKNRKLLKPWLPWVPGVKEIKDSKKFILKCRKDYKKGDSLELGIWYKGKLVGCAGLHHIDKTSRNTTVGYWLSSDYHGQGIVTRSVRTLLSYAFGELNLNRVEIVAGTTNAKSYAVAERLGFVKEGVKRETEFVDNRFLDYAIYSLLRREWKNN